MWFDNQPVTTIAITGVALYTAAVMAGALHEIALSLLRQEERGVARNSH